MGSGFIAGWGVLRNKPSEIVHRAKNARDFSCCVLLLGRVKRAKKRLFALHNDQLVIDVG